MWVADYTSRISPAALSAAGVVGVCRYLAPSGDAWKRITPKEYQELTDAGFTVVLNWEHAELDWLGGSSAGKSMGQQAVQEAKALGYRANGAIPSSADFNMNSGQWNLYGKEFGKAYADVVGSAGYTPGVYSHVDVLNECHALGFGMKWQSMSKSYGFSKNANATRGQYTDLWQQLPQRTVAGSTVDYNEIISNRWSGAEMELTDVVTTNGQNKAVASILGDTEAILMWGATAGGPGANSWLVRTLTSIATAVNAPTKVQLTPDTITTMTQDIAQAVISSPHNGLGQADLDAVAQVVHGQLTKLHVDVSA